ncbi:HAMP domain-containing histidine kinase [Pelomonas sp. CA6]|uniref:tetratricopeptide repeat-containing sensor histidine kinase n=1 Tax=Pelomonas sp. CA6 TaxID=2907999 RepID=UPI001F4BD41F|nr:HAMP domain-containing sensor histidine kinase [Pelomonas sp. CA6]MCH7344389.1 HAMP domain-containing histidine kinase [Pelomonas sp. CA6]
MAMNEHGPQQVGHSASQAMQDLEAALGRALSMRGNDDEAEARVIAEAVRRCDRCGEPRGALLFTAYRTLLSGTGLPASGGVVPVPPWFVIRLGGPLPADAEASALKEIQASSDQRAIWIAQLSASHQKTRTDAQTPNIGEWIRLHRARQPDDVSPQERLLAEKRYTLMLALDSQFGPALGQAVRWRNMAVRQEDPQSELQADNTISASLMSLGDVDGALPLLLRLLDSPLIESERARQALYYNAMLCHVLRREYDQALHLARQAQKRLPATVLAGGPGLPVLMGFVFVQTGHPQEAADMLRGQADWVDAVGPTMAGNRAWLLARILLRQGRASDARALCQTALDKFAERGWSLSPLNGTQLHATLADACEALEAHGDALRALRESRSYCFNWIVDSVTMRLRTLLVDGADGDEQKLNRRLEALVALGHESTAAAKPEAAPPHYVAYLAHEIRNPLNGLVMMTELLQQTRLSRRQSQYVNMASSSALALMHLCDDLLDLARLDAGRFDMHQDAVDLGALVRSLVGAFQLQTAGRPIVLSASIDARLPPLLRSDERRLRQVLMNLLGNAAKFTERGRIDVEVLWEQPSSEGGDAGTLCVSVRDTGIGFPAEVKAQLFEEFFQAAEAPESSRAAGTGLGLALCRSIVQQMGGAIDASSVPGQGSRFWFTLPVARWQGLPEATPA